MGKRVFSFDDYVNNRSTANESKIGDFLSKAKSKIGDAYTKVKEFVTSIGERIAMAIADNKIKPIPSGPKKGTYPIAYFDPKDGDLVKQVNDYYRGTEFAKMNPIKESLLFSSEYSLDEAQVPLEYTGEDQSVRDVGIDELKEMLEELYLANEMGEAAKPIFIYGAPGIGKTQVVAQAAKALGVPMLPLDLQFMAPEDMLGIPKVVDLENPTYDDKGKLITIGKGLTRSNPTALLPIDNGPDGKGGFIFMDEFNRAGSSILNAMMQFVQMGRLGSYQLPDKWVVVAAGNRSSDVGGFGQVQEFDFATANRFTIVNFVPEVKKWAGWAKSSGKFQPEMVDFVENNPELFHYLDTEKATLVFPTPRSWTDAAMALKSKMAIRKIKDWRDLPTDTIFNIYSDAIGPVAAGKLKAYLDIIKRISDRDLEDIVKNPEKAKPLAKGQNFSSVAYGVFEMALKKAEELSGGKATIQDLFNIMKYYQGLDNLEILSWAFARAKEKYPEIAVTQEVMDTRDTPESKLKIEMGMMIANRMKDKGLNIKVK